MSEKECIRCNQIKDISEFGKNKKKKDGLQVYCKECRRQEGKKYYYEQGGKEKVQERQKTDEYKKNRSEYIKEYSQTEQGKEVIKRGRDKWLNSEKGQDYNKEYSKKYKQTDKYKKYAQEYEQGRRKELALEKQKEFQNNNTHKECTGQYACYQILPLSSFNKDKTTNTGYEHTCKECKKKNKQSRKNILNQKQKEFQNNNNYLICIRCKKELTLNNFRIKNDTSTGYNSVCKNCNLKEERTVEYLNKQKEYYARKDVKIAKNKYKKNKKDTDIQFKIRCNVSTMICNRLKSRLASKEGKSTFDILPYTIEDLMIHLESQFQDGMSWDNYGAGEDKWEIDHMTPDSWFNYESTDDVDFLKSWALENLQPMWCFDNRSKNNRFASEQVVLNN